MARKLGQSFISVHESSLQDVAFFIWGSERESCLQIHVLGIITQQHATPHSFQKQISLSCESINQHLFHPKTTFPLQMSQEQMDESRWFVEKVATLEPLQQCLMSQQLQWAILGAGTVGLTLALLMAESMLSRGCDPNEACIHVYESQWIEKCAETSKWKRSLDAFFCSGLFGRGYLEDIGNLPIFDLSCIYGEDAV